ncbi:MAG TPA: hypothetical protein VFJ58_07580 [Armatimonadota bacterium]|nr:hypothetical protein [Armatimonadota bacterium]
MKFHLLFRPKGRTIVFGLAIAAALAAFLFYQFVFRPGQAMRHAAYEHFAASAAALRAGDDAQVETELIAAIAAWPQYASAYARLGDFYSNHKQPGLAITAYRRLIEIAPDYPDVYGSLAQACEDDSADGDARRYANEELKRDPTSLIALDTLALLDRQSHDYRNAIAEARKAYTLQPKDPRAIITYAQSLLRDDPVTAAKVLVGAQKIMPQSWEVAYDLGYCYSHGGGGPAASVQAMAQLRHAEAIDDTQALVHQEICQLLLQKQQFVQAAHEGELAVKADPYDSEALLLYSQALDWQGKHAQAAPIAAESRVLIGAQADKIKIQTQYGGFPTDPAVAHRLAIDDLKLGRTREAVLVLETALSAHQSDKSLRADMLGLLRAGVSP